MGVINQLSYLGGPTLYGSSRTFWKEVGLVYDLEGVLYRLSDSGHGSMGFLFTTIYYVIVYPCKKKSIAIVSPLKIC